MKSSENASKAWLASGGWQNWAAGRCELAIGECSLGATSASRDCNLASSSRSRGAPFGILARFTTKSPETKSEKDEGNKRLAMIGDALIRLAILDDWYPNGATIGKLVRCQHINSMI